MSINGRAKGASGEREFCKWLKQNFNLDYLPERNLEQVRNGGADILGVEPFVFEIKRVENLDLQAAWNQCVFASRKLNGEPVVAYRKNRQPWRFLISAQHLDLARGYIQLEERIFIQWAKRVLEGSYKPIEGVRASENPLSSLSPSRIG